MRKQAMQSPEIAAGRFRVGRIGIGAIEQHDVAEHRRIVENDLEFIERQADRIEFCLRMCNKNGAHRCRPFAAGARAVTSHERVDQAAFARARSTKECNDQRRLETDSQVLGSGKRAPNQRPGAVDRLPGGFRLRPLREACDDVVDARQQFELSQFR